MNRLTEILLSLYEYSREELAVLTDDRAPYLLATAALCGFLTGLEREIAGKPAGLRTNMFICIGSTLFTLASVLSFKHVAGEHTMIDPGRIAAQVVSGVGFLGAGVILRTGLHITGITTAATIWLVAAIGMVIGLGFPFLGFSVTVVTTITLFCLGYLERALLPNRKIQDDAE